MNDLILDIIGTNDLILASFLLMTSSWIVLVLMS